MKKKCILLLFIFITASVSAMASSNIDIPVKDGLITLLPLKEHVLRIQYKEREENQLPELIYIDTSEYSCSYQIEKNDNQIEVNLPFCRVNINYTTGLLELFNQTNRGRPESLG